MIKSLKINIILSIFIVLSILTLLVSCTMRPIDYDESAKVSNNVKDNIIVDSHLHYYDFNQETDGFEELIKKMDEAKVDKAVIFGLPLKKQWDDTMKDLITYRKNNNAKYYYYSATDYKLLEEYSNLTKDKRDRFYPFICGINPCDRYSAKFLRELLENYKGSIYGIGEIICKHDKLTEKTFGDEPLACNDTMFDIYDLAAEYDIPVLLHNNVTKIGSNVPLYIDEMKKALEHNTKTKIIWAHAGISNGIEIEKYYDIIELMLKTYDNLYIDISWVFYTNYIKLEPVKWALLIEKYKDRFMVGTDLAGVFRDYKKTVDDYKALLTLLQSDTKFKVFGNNIYKLIVK